MPCQSTDILGVHSLARLAAFCQLLREASQPDQGGFDSARHAATVIAEQAPSALLLGMACKKQSRCKSRARAD